MNADLRALHTAVNNLLKARRKAQRTAKALHRNRSWLAGACGWDQMHHTEQLGRDADSAQGQAQQAEAEVLTLWEALNTPPRSPPPLLADDMRASEAPTINDPTWNKYRSQVIAAITDEETLLQQLGKGTDNAGMTYDVAKRLGLRIDTDEDFDVLAKLVRATRHIGREGLRMTREDQGGQFSLLLR